MNQEYKIPLGKFYNWCFTYNNYTEDIVSKIRENLKKEAKYWVFGYEKAPTTGTPHLQGYVEFETQRTWSGVQKKVFDGRCSWLVPRNGTAAIASSYCKKGEQSHEEFDQEGVDGPNYGRNVRFEESEEHKIGKQGKRTDIELAKKLISEGKGMRHIVQEVNSYQAVKMSELILKYKENVRNWAPIVIWLWGPTGCGKTRYAYDEAKKEMAKYEAEKYDSEPYFTNGELTWWEGYDAHPVVVIDEFREHHAKLDQMLRITDRYPYRVQNKGSTRQLLAKVIFITSCYPPDELYRSTAGRSAKNRDSVKQLLRRITSIINLATDTKWKKELESRYGTNDGFSVSDLVQDSEDDDSLMGSETEDELEHGTITQEQKIKRKLKRRFEKKQRKIEEDERSIDENSLVTDSDDNSESSSDTDSKEPEKSIKKIVKKQPTNKTIIEISKVQKKPVKVANKDKQISLLKQKLNIMEQLMSLGSLTKTPLR